MRPFDNIPEGWQVARLGDIAQVAFSSVDKNTVDGEIPVDLCNYTDVFYNRQIRPEMGFMSATATQREYSQWSLKQGDVLFTKDSETRNEIGISSFVVEDMQDVLCGYHLGRARPNPGVLDGQFLSEALGSQLAKKELARIANGTTRFGLTLESTRALPVLLPPLAEQRDIANILNAIDEAIESTESSLVATQQLRDSLQDQLLTLGVPGWHSEWQEIPKLGIAPADWQITPLHDVADIAFSSVDKKAMLDEIPVKLCNYTDVFYNRKISSDLDFMTATATPAECSRWKLKRGDVIFTKDSETRDEIGVPAYVAEDIPNLLCGYHLAVARPRVSRVDGAFLMEVLASTKSRQQFARIANGTTRYGLTLDSARAFLIPLPCLVEQRTIVSALFSIDDLIDQTRAEILAAQVLKTSVSDGLLTGRMRMES